MVSEQLIVFLIVLSCFVTRQVTLLFSFWCYILNYAAIRIQCRLSGHMHHLFILSHYQCCYNHHNSTKDSWTNHQLAGFMSLIFWHHQTTWTPLWWMLACDDAVKNIMLFSICWGLSVQAVARRLKSFRSYMEKNKDKKEVPIEATFRAQLRQQSS